MLKKKISYVYQFLLVLLAIICLILACEMFIMKTSLLSTNHWIKTTKKSGYTQKLTDTINQSIQDLGLGSGIKSDGLQDVISEEQVSKDFNMFLENTLNGSPYMVDQEAIKKTISEAIMTYSKKENIPLNTENTESVDQFINQSYLIYDQSLRNNIISTSFLRINLVKKSITIVMYGSFFLLLILLTFSYLAGNRYKHVFMRNLSYLFTSTTLLILLGSYLFYQHNPVKSLSLFDENLNNWLYAGLKSPLLFNLILSVVFLLLGVGLAIYSYNSYKQLEVRGFRRSNK